MLHTVIDLFSFHSEICIVPFTNFDQRLLKFFLLINDGFLIDSIFQVSPEFWYLKEYLKHNWKELN